MAAHLHSRKGAIVDQKNNVSSKKRDNSSSVYFSGAVKARLDALSERLPHDYSRSSLIENLVQYALDDIERIQCKPSQLKFLLFMFPQEREGNQLKGNVRLS